jgi:hypothetical protein
VPISRTNAKKPCQKWSFLTREGPAEALRRLRGTSAKNFSGASDLLPTNCAKLGSFRRKLSLPQRHDARQPNIHKHGLTCTAPNAGFARGLKGGFVVSPGAKRNPPLRNASIHTWGASGDRSPRWRATAFAAQPRAALRVAECQSGGRLCCGALPSPCRAFLQLTRPWNRSQGKSEV